MSLNNVGSEVVTGQSQKSVRGSQSQEEMSCSSGELGATGRGGRGLWNVSVPRGWFAAAFVSGSSRKSRGVMRFRRITNAVSVHL